MRAIEAVGGSHYNWPMYSATTRHIAVSVIPAYLEDQSRPEMGEYLWAYKVKIENQGGETVTLRHRYWKIIDARGHVQEVRGAGVVGEEPTLAPGEVFEYTSGTPLPTSSGFMTGAYEMETQGGETFSVSIPDFSLDNPHERALVH